MRICSLACLSFAIATDECYDLCARQFPGEHCDTYCKQGDICHAMHWTSFEVKNGISLEQFASDNGPPVTCTEARDYLRLPPFTTTTTTSAPRTTRAPQSTTEGYPIDNMSLEDIIDDTFESMSPEAQRVWMRGLGWDV